ncbi:uncharacterized protein [Medicago truncatula]|uniref:uncharacterized protein n=1 Tax=Medicago truncatula TaxID=3880 RepID=UPI0019682CD5|nr:uncharacterized protein LOC112417817 [Medicago truncatula]
MNTSVVTPAPVSPPCEVCGIFGHIGIDCQLSSVVRGPEQNPVVKIKNNEGEIGSDEPQSEKTIGENEKPFVSPPHEPKNPLTQERKPDDKGNIMVDGIITFIAKKFGVQDDGNDDGGDEEEFYPHYTPETADFSKCIKFENGLRAEFKRAIGYQKIRVFFEMRMVEDRRPKKKDAPAEIVCFTCGEKGHKSNACPWDAKRCFRCGKKGHALAECKHDDIVCFNCNEERHIGA